MKTLVFFLIAVCCNCFSQTNPKIPKSGLVAYYPFNSNFNDESGNNNHGQILTSVTGNGGVEFTSDRWESVNNKNACGFSGKWGDVGVKNSNSLKTIESNNTISISVWVLTHNGLNSKGGEFTILTKHYCWDLSINEKGRVVFRGADEKANAFKFKVEDTNWHHYAFTYSLADKKAKLYFDGKFVEEKEIDVLLSSEGNSSLDIGRFRSGSNVNIDEKKPNRAGVIDDIRIYNRLLDEQEVDFLFKEEPDTKNPILVINNPEFLKLPNQPNLVVTNDALMITGIAYDTSPLTLYFNDQEVKVNSKHEFSVNLPLVLGTNTAKFVAIDTRKNTTAKTYIIERKANATPPPIQTVIADPIAEVKSEVVRSNEPTLQPKVENTIKIGTYYALIIGNNVYQSPEIKQLDEPVKDAEKLYEVLVNQYSFDNKNVTFLKNATFKTIIGELDRLSDLITPNDNLLIFYAGHGQWDEKKRLGYWLPTDAEKANTASWLRNSTIQDYIKSINTKHTLVIADACFSGGIFKTRSAFVDASRAINKLYEMPSRKAMTSGTLKVVPDVSKFLFYLVKKLQDNTEPYISADRLFNSFRDIVMNNSTTEPQYGTIQEVGDEGGEFIFVKRNR